MKLFACVIAVFLVLAGPVLARHYHHRHHIHHHYAHRHRVERVVQQPQAPQFGFGTVFDAGSSVLATAQQYIGAGAEFGRRDLWCARFVNYVLKKTGHEGTGSDAAASFAHYGRPVSAPVPGAIAVMHRRGGGHVGIVAGVDARGNPIIVSGNNGGRVRVSTYPANRVYAYRAP